MRSSLLITDYSSVSWNFYYFKKPVAFFQFDYATYEELQGSYIDLKKDLFGERFTDADKPIEGIKAYIAKDFKLDVKYKEIWNQSFKYVDKKIAKERMKLLKETLRS